MRKVVEGARQALDRMQETFERLVRSPTGIPKKHGHLKVARPLPSSLNYQIKRCPSGHDYAMAFIYRLAGCDEIKVVRMHRRQKLIDLARNNA